MSQDEEQSIWWKDLTASDVCGAGDELRDLIEIKDDDGIDMSRVCQLWCLLYALGKHKEMKGFLNTIETTKPAEVTEENASVGREWIKRYAPVLEELKKLNEMMSTYPGDYESLNNCVNCLSENLKDFGTEINLIVLRERNQKRAIRLLPRRPSS